MVVVNALADDPGVSKSLVWLPRVKNASYAALPRAQDGVCKVEKLVYKQVHLIGLK